MLTLTLRVTQKHVFCPPKIKTPFMSPSLQSFHVPKRVWDYTKKRETCETLKIAKEQKKKRMKYKKVLKY